MSELPSSFLLENVDRVLKTNHESREDTNVLANCDSLIANRFLLNLIPHGC